MSYLLNWRRNGSRQNPGKRLLVIALASMMQSDVLVVGTHWLKLGTFCQICQVLAAERCRAIRVRASAVGPSLAAPFCRKLLRPADGISRTRPGTTLSISDTPRTFEKQNEVLTLTYFHLLSPTFTYFHLLSPTFTYFHLLSPTFTYFHLLSPIFVYT